MATQNSINTGSPIEATHGGSGLASPTAHGILVAEGASAFNPIVLTNGQLLVGSTGADPSAATLTAGTGISITNGAGSITIASSAVSGGGWIWVDQTTNTTMAAGHAYSADVTGGATFTLPAVAAFGDSFLVTGSNNVGWTIAQQAGQTIHFGTAATTTGVGGSLASTNRWDCVQLTCIVANTVFIAYNAQGNLTVV